MSPLFRGRRPDPRTLLGKPSPGGLWGQGWHHHLTTGPVRRALGRMPPSLLTMLPPTGLRLLGCLVCTRCSTAAWLLAPTAREPREAWYHGHQLAHGTCSRAGQVPVYRTQPPRRQRQPARSQHGPTDKSDNASTSSSTIASTRRKSASANSSTCKHCVGNVYFSTFTDIGSVQALFRLSFFLLNQDPQRSSAARPRSARARPSSAPSPSSSPSSRSR